MSDLKMPSPPKRHYWEIKRDTDQYEDWLVVSLHRKTMLGPEFVDCKVAHWHADGTNNALTAVDLANQILKSQRGANGQVEGLADLTGYQWGGTW